MYYVIILYNSKCILILPSYFHINGIKGPTERLLRITLVCIIPTYLGNVVQVT